MMLTLDVIQLTLEARVVSGSILLGHIRPTNCGPRRPSGVIDQGSSLAAGRCAGVVCPDS